MPTYRHLCSKCNHIDDTMYSIKVFDENATMECPKCNEKTWERQFVGTTAFELNGPGWYVNDYGKHAWRNNLSHSDQAEVLLGNRDPY